MAHIEDRVATRGADFNSWLENMKNRVAEKTTGLSPKGTHIPRERIRLFTHAAHMIADRRVGNFMEYGAWFLTGTRLAVKF
ncbi:MAG: hypothetical protein LBD79_01435 [Treponema sp.]|nr:hypothetical protein [Treponema sp.]